MMFGGRAMLTIALVFLLSAGALSAWLWDEALFSSPRVISCSENPSNLDWMALSFVALLFGLAVNACAWILGGVLSTQKYQDFLKGSLWAFLEGVVILSILSASMLGLREYGEANINTARGYAVIIRNTVMTDFAMVLGANTLFSFYTNVNPQFRPFVAKLGLTLTFQIAPAFRPIYDTLGLLMQLMTTAILEWFAHDFMLCFVRNNMLMLLLPAGIFMRAFGLKGGGNALIGIALAFYFAYPFMLVQAGQIVTRHVQNEIAPPSQAQPYPHAWNLCTDRPICCIGLSGKPDNETEAYIENGRDSATSLNGRISVKKLVTGPIRISLTGNDAGITTGATCIYKTMLGKAYTGITGSISDLDFWSITKGVGAGVATFFIIKLLNISLLSVALAFPMVAFAQLATYETIYFLFIVSIVLPIFNIFITLTLAKEITKVLGTEIDLSALEKLI